MLCLNLSDVANFTIKNNCRCIFYDISKSEAIHLLKHCVPDNRGYI